MSPSRGKQQTVRGGALPRMLLYVAAILSFVFAVFPFFWAFVSSIKGGAELFSPSLWPAKPEWQNYSAVFFEQPFAKNILNSAIVAITTTLASLLLGLSASYALSRREFRGRRAVLLAFLLISMFPQIAVLSGLFEVLRALGLYNRVAGLCVSYLIFTLPFTVWVLSTFMRQVPRSLEEAAIMDGATTSTIVFRIFLPLLAPAMVTTGLLAFIAAWNEFLFAVTFTLSDDARTVPVAIAFMSGSSQHELPWGRIMAAAVVVTLPLVFLVLIFQRRIVSGLTAGAVKG